MAKLHFYGGSLSVTGSNYLIETKNSKVVIDCGMFQGSGDQERKNYEDFPYDPATVDAVFITHSHIDHIGRLPKLVKDGFSGKVFGTEPTIDLVPVMLKDSQHIIEQQAKKDTEPMYSKKDVKNTTKLLRSMGYGEAFDVSEDVRVRFRDAGHILGSAIVEVWIKENDKETKIVFSGDLGNPPAPFLNDTEFIDEADYLLVETVYGNRIHEDREERKKLLKEAIIDTIGHGGTLMIPAFALERTQELIFEINQLMKNKKIPEVPIFLDSPLAIDATNVYKNYYNYFNGDAQRFTEKGNKMFRFPQLKFTYETEESKEINEIPPPKVILAGSGMSTAGRILHHERRYLPDPNSMLLIMGYQAKGTLGRRLLDGVKEIKLFGEEVPVRAHLRAIGGYSAHADKNTLYNWVENVYKNSKNLKTVFCVQGEEEAATAFALKLRDDMRIYAKVPEEGDVLEF
ncbi:MAG: MBL fold metallo-hydrolase [Candidatus Spechtbacterales bacterium]